MPTPSHNPILCALDMIDVEEAKKLAQTIKPHIGGIKLGLEFFTANGPAGVRAIAETELPIFLDLKLHDIPNTVAGAMRAIATLPCFMLTIHTTGGLAMMRAAKEAASEAADRAGRPSPYIIGVTILTSMDQEDIASLGIEHAIGNQVERLATLAQEAKLDGIVCSPQEVDRLRPACGADFRLVVPGIRPEGASAGDQKRTLTPKEALSRGADYLVIGRPIIQSATPAAAAEAINLSLR